MKAIEFSELPSKSTLMKRFDRKFLCSDDQMDALLQALDSTHCYVNVQGVSHQVYQNEYWDKPNKDFYNDHRRGIPRRLKFRRRTYQGNGLSFWELKVKHPRGYQDKRRMTMDQAAASNGELAGLANRAFGLLLGDGRQRPNPSELLEPSMHITYQRMTLWDPAAGSRLTVDSQLQASLGGVRLEFPKWTLVELKQARRERHAVDALVAQGLLKACAFSKYHRTMQLWSGMAQGHGGLCSEMKRYEDWVGQACLVHRSEIL